MVAEAAVWAALAEVQDPELPVGIVDLGLVRSVRVEGGAVTVGITFTSIACPCTDVLAEDVAKLPRRVKCAMLGWDALEEAEKKLAAE